MRPTRTYDDPIAYRLRVLGCILASQCLLWAAFRFWPIQPASPNPARVYDIAGQEIIALEEIMPTRQLRQAPRPPAPPVPVVSPDDILLDTEMIFDDRKLALDVYGEEENAAVGNEAIAAGLAAPATAPRAIRFVEPEYTSEARRNRVRAEVVVRVLVDEKGAVVEATLVERYQVDAAGENRQPVTKLAYGLEEASVEAARRWLFQPAREAGRSVRSYTTLTFRFGV
ncbi:MAG: energy transducer TonB [Rhodothermales bacterium]|nr:energy transducer TonB [Rhodothermales bacterium]